MKRKMLLVAIIAIGFGIPAGAAVTIDQTLTPEYVENNGYSSQMYEAMAVSRARALGEEYDTAGEKRAKKLKQPLAFLRKLYNYIDPAAEDYSFYHHDTKSIPGYTDL